jgi:hypothetical protein
MNIEEQYRKPNLASEPFFYLNSDELEANIAFIKEKKIENLMLISNLNGYNLKNLDFLEDLPLVKNIQMGACPQIENFSGLSNLSNLATLVITPNKKIEVDLSNLLSLEDLGLSFTSKIKGLEKLINLKTIRVDNGTDMFFDLEIFKNYKKLKHLGIAQSIIKNDLSFLKENKGIEFLEFNYMRRGFSIQGIQYLKNSLKKLKFVSSKEIDDIVLVSELTKLTGLFFSESVKLKNTEIIRPLKKLNAFNMFGSSSFIDGDLRSLKEMRDTIKHYKVQDKKHYFYE